MLKYHMTDDYSVKRCTARKKKCQYLKDGEETHFNTEVEAYSYLEKKMSQEASSPILTKRGEKVSLSSEIRKMSVREDGTAVYNVVQKPSIYGFISTKLNEANDAYIVKVGYTSRPPHIRFEEWKEEGGIYSEEYFQEEFVIPAIIKDPITGKEHYVMDHNFHKYFERNGFQKLIDRSFDNAGTDHISKEFYIGEDGKKRITQEIIDDCVKDQEENLHNSGSGYTFYDESEQKVVSQYVPVNDFKPRSFQEEVIEKTSNYFLNESDDNSGSNDDKRFLLTAPTRSGKSFMAAQSLMKTFDEAKKKNPAKKNHCAVVVSGFAEIEDEWKKTFQTHKDFNQSEIGTAETNKCGVSPCRCSTKFKYLSKADLTNNPNAVEDAYAAGAENVVVFLTLQDLAGSTSEKGKVKEEHKFLETPGAVDMLVGDEAHLAMFTENGRYQEALNGYGETEEEIKSNTDDLEKLDTKMSNKDQKTASGRLQQIKPNLGSLFITATPYNVLSDGSKFNIDENVVIITEEQIIEEQKNWLKNNPDKEAWESPYYGLPEKKFFGLDVGIAANELFDPVDTKDSSKGFKNHKHVQQVLSGLFGQEGIAPNVMKDENFAAAGIGNNVYATLPYCASCDAMEEELKRFLRENNMEDEYEILNISSAKGDSHPVTALTTQQINQRISNSKKKTITLTVNRMGTGVTQEKWDTVLMMRGMTSAQQFEQTAGRCGTPYVKEYETNVNPKICRDCMSNDVRAEGKKLCQKCYDKGGQELEESFAYEKIKDCPKPNVAVITFDPISMVTFKRNKAVSLTGNQGKTTDEQTSGESVDESLDRSLSDIEHFIYRLDATGLQQLDKNNIMEYYLKGMQNRSVGDIADSIKIHTNVSSLDAEAKALLEVVSAKGFDKNSQKTAVTSRMTERSDGKCWVDGCGQDIREGLTQEGNSYRLCENHYQIEQKRQDILKNAENKTVNQRSAAEQALITEKQELERKIRNTYARTLLYAMLSDSNEMGVRTVIDEIRAAMPSESNGFVEGRAAEMARHLDLDIRVLELIRDNNIGGLQLDDSIRQMELILSDKNKVTANKWDKFKLALNSFNSLSSNEILTPRNVSAMLINKLDMSAKDWQSFKQSKSGTIDVGCKSAVNLVEFYDRGLANGLSHDELKNKMFSIPSSGASYELISKIYDEYGWDKRNILFVDGVNNLDTLKAVSLAKEMKECQSVDPETCQYHQSVKNGGRGTTNSRLDKGILEIFDKIDDEKAKQKLRNLMDKVKDMPKFDFVVSNPPYQISSGGNSYQIYSDFYMSSVNLATKLSMIFPIGWQTSTGNGSGSRWHKTMRSDKKVVSVDNYYEQSDSPVKVFDVSTGGVNIICSDEQKNDNKFVQFYEYGNLIDSNRDMNVVKYWSEKTQGMFDAVKDWSQKSSVKDMSGLITGRTPYGIRAYMTTDPSRDEYKYFKEEESNISVWSKKGKKYDWHYIPDDAPFLKKPNIDKWKAVWPITGGNANYRRIMKFEPNQIFSDTFICTFFEKEEHTDNFITYFKTNFYRFMLTEATNDHTANRSHHRFIPDLSTVKNPRTGKIGWDSDWTDEDLKILFKDVLTDEDWEYIEKTALASDGGKR